MTAAEKALGCSSATSNTISRAGLECAHFKTNRDVRELKWQHKVRNMPKVCRTMGRESEIGETAGNRTDDSSLKITINRMLKYDE